MSFSPNQSTGSLSTTYIIIYSVINTQENLCSLKNKTVGLPLCREHQSDGDLKFYIRTLRSSTVLWYLFPFNNNICWIIGRRQTGILVDKPSFFSLFLCLFERFRNIYGTVFAFKSNNLNWEIERTTAKPTLSYFVHLYMYLSFSYAYYI